MTDASHARKSETGRTTHAARHLGPAGIVPAAALLFTLLAGDLPVAADRMAVDVAIVFAVDISSSIGPEHADLQRKGHADALRSKEVATAIARGRTGCIAITYVEWSVPRWLRTVLPWTRVCSDDDRNEAAATILLRGDTGLERRGRGGTAVSYALDASSFLLDRFPGRAERKIIDISANGTNNDGLAVADVRKRVLAKGYVINAIVLDRAEPGISDDLPGYFRHEVIGGAGAFVVVPDDSADFSHALRRKLVLEISAADPGGSAHTSNRMRVLLPVVN